MLKNHRKKLAMFLAAGLIISTLSACGSEDTPTGGSTSTPTPTANDQQGSNDSSGDDNQADATPEVQEDDPFPGANLGGVTLKVHGFQNPETAEEAKKEMWRERQAEVEEKFNVKLSFDPLEGVDWNDVPDVVVASVAANDPVTDMGDMSTTYWFPTLAVNNVVIEVDDMVKNFGFPEEYLGTAMQWQGKTYGFSAGPLLAFCTIAFNRDMIKAAGMEKDPGELFKEGKWSLTDFYDYCAELATKLPEGVYVMGMHPNNYLRGAAYANGSFIKDPITNIPGYLSDGFLEVAEVYQKMVLNGIHKPPTWLEDQNRNTLGYAEQGFKEGEMAMTNGNSWDFGGFAAEFDFGIVPFPWGSKVTISNNDYTTLSDEYSSYYKDGGVRCFIKGSEKKATPEQMANIFFSYDKELGASLLENMKRAEEGLPAIDAQYGRQRDFTTDLDIELWDWYTTRSKFEVIDRVSASSALGIAIHVALSSNVNLRTAFEEVIGEDVWSMVQEGYVNESDIPADMKAKAEAFGAAAAEEETEE